MRFLVFLSLLVYSATLHASVSVNQVLSSLNSSVDSHIGVVNIIHQDDLGFIWFGGANGLARYDGHQLKTYRHILADSSSLPSNYVTDIEFDQKGQMWVATTGGLARFEPENERFEQFRIHRKGGDQQGLNSVTSLAIDRLDQLMVGTHNGLAIINAERSDVVWYGPKLGDSESLTDGYVRSLYVDSRNNLWVGTASGGLNLFRPETETFVSFLHSGREANSLSGNDVRSIQEDYLGRLWVGTYGAGLNLLDERTNTFKHYLTYQDPSSLNSGYAIHQLLSDDQQTLWAATDHGGLAYYDELTDDFKHVRHDVFDQQSIRSDHVRAVFEDSTGDLWISTFPGAIDFYNRSSSVFRNYVHNPYDKATLSHSGVLCIAPFEDQKIWVGTEDGLNLFDVSDEVVLRTFRKGRQNEDLAYSTILSLEKDADGSYWVGTWSGGLHRYHPKTDRFTNFINDPRELRSLSNNYVWDVFLDSKNRLWVATEKGLNQYIRETGDFVSYTTDASDNNAIINDNVRNILEFSNGDLWIATYGGLEKFDPSTGSFQHFQENANDPSAIRGSRIAHLLESSSGRMWVATLDAGINIYTPETGQFEHLGVHDGLPTNEITGLIEDDQGNIWASSPLGLIRIEPNTLKVRHISKAHGLVGNNFNRSANYKDKNGNLYFGSTEGLTVFHPSQLTPMSNTSPVHITAIRPLLGLEQASLPSLNGVTSQGVAIKENLIRKDYLSLDSSVLGFTFEFALLSYRSSQMNSYAYMLQGFDTVWRISGPQNQATYTNIPPGNYVFKVKAANKDGLWSTNEDALVLELLPPYWLTWWAYCIYGALSLLAILYFWRTQLKRSELIRERKLNAKLLKVDRIKHAILANTSHELRSPLNNIVGITESLIEGMAGDLNNAAKDYLRVVVKNTKKLLSLVDNILDYASLVDDEKKIISRPVDVYLLVKAALSTIHSSKEVAIKNKVSRSAPMILADEERLLQVMINLIDNALRHTERGSVVIESEELDQVLEIRVKDTGCGMSPEQVERLFQPFSTTEGFELGPLGGIGLGLAMSKHLVELHGGAINVSSILGEGSCFSLRLPLDKVYTVKQIPSPSFKQASGDFQLEAHPDVHADQALSLESALQAAALKLGDRTILIVDDDGVNRMVISSMLNHYGFITLEAESGQAALDILNKSESGVHLIIMDVMMPQWSGYETCKVIRKKWTMSQLPIIFLTAKRVAHSSTDGFLAGGNDFVSKPVSKYELLPRVINILRDRT